MPARTSSTWLPRLLFRLSLLIATGLVGLVIVSPWTDITPGSGLASAPREGNKHRNAWSRLLSLFARDQAVRRTAVASAVGLWVTASVFFWTPRKRRGSAVAEGARLNDSSGNVVGA
jgi:hypothetical protein